VAKKGRLVQNEKKAKERGRTDELEGIRPIRKLVKLSKPGKTLWGKKVGRREMMCSGGEKTRVGRLDDDHEILLGRFPYI